MSANNVPASSPENLLKVKVRQLYAFLKEANQLQFRPVRKLSDQQQVIKLSDIPQHPSVQIFKPIRVQESQELPETLLKVSRPKITRCPAPPDSLIEWVLPGWDDPSIKADYAQSRNRTEKNEKDEDITVTELFEDRETRLVDFAAWNEKREQWSTPELVARSSLRFFEAFYSLHAKIEKEGERLELMVADGILSWVADSGIDGSVQINHPILLKRVELRFNAKIPEFTVHETERDVELYTSLFIDLKNIESASIRNRKLELEQSAYHPLGWEDTSAFLRSVVMTISPTDGEFLDDPTSEQNTSPKIWRDPVLLLRKRVDGIANAVDKIIDDIDVQSTFPPSLIQITGEVATPWVSAGLSGAESGSADQSNGVQGQLEAQEILLVNEANDEQIQIVKRLERSGSVVVQGPPGTGKTHTISNLIGHLLSQGKSILVTAHTTKALRVLRDKVPDMLQPLCVSVLGSDQAARRQLESAISSITERLTSETSESLHKKSIQYGYERKEIVDKELSKKHLLRQAIENEYKEIDVGGKKYSPTEAARFIEKHKTTLGWIPSPIKLGVDIQNYLEDVKRLYTLNGAFTKEEEYDARLSLPTPENLPSEGRFVSKVSDYKALITKDLSLGKDKWNLVPGTNSESLADILEKVQSEFDDALLSQSWRPYAIVAGIHGGNEKEVWEVLATKIEQTVDSGAKYALALHHRPQLAQSITIYKQVEILTQICIHLESGGKLGMMQLATKSEWRQVINTCTVAAGKPVHLDHFKAILQFAELQINRLALEELWNSLIGQHIGKPFNQLGSTPEQSCRALLPEIRRCLSWSSTVWYPLADKLRKEGLRLDDLISALPRDTSQTAEYQVIENFARTTLIKFIEIEALRRKFRETEGGFEKLREIITAIDPTQKEEGCIDKLIKAVANKDPVNYETALIYLRRIHTLQPLTIEREKLITRLEEIAPNWANALRNRDISVSNLPLPEEITQAWLFRQLNDTLLERDKLDAHEIQSEIENCLALKREVTRNLVDSLAWGGQLKRLQENNSMRQALVGWLDTAKRLASTRQVDKRQTLLAEARQLMKRCSQAVPVWIMPISIMAESFDPQVTKFDVVIIDEASQADINALIPLYMGKQIIVVGDHEQVTPLGVGKDQTILENLRKSMLQDIPNAHLYDNMSSIYDLARQSFGEGVRLIEHFRCVPEIIGFSNTLSYEGKIRALRESGSSNLLPACIPYQINGIRDGDTNKIEAEKIVSLIKAMIKHPEYAGKSIGIISMLGEAQAVLIQSLIIKEISSVEIEGRRIQAGISGEFQGDERDVILLSLVDSAKDTNALRATGDGAFEQTKKRYNVAASRARDQLWVIHSFDPDLHLKASDIRYKLIQHVRDPKAAARNYEQQVGRVESPFEKEVLKKLTSAGYRVKIQVEVGYFRIDMVVEGQGKRLAVECDGDRYHPIEKLAEDMNRQAILERLGWIFIRIRGSAFYRDPDLAIQPVFRKLEELGIEPTSSETFEPTNANLVVELESLMSNSFAEIENFDGQIGNSEFDSSIEQEVGVVPESQQLNSQKEQRLYEPVIPRGKSENNKLALAEYKIYDGPPCLDPRTSTRTEIILGLMRIIEVEGPVQIKRVFDIYLRSCGIKRMGHDLRDELVSCIEYLKKNGDIKTHKYIAEEDSLTEITWKTGTPSEILRTRGDRTLEEIPMEELAAIYKLITSKSPSGMGAEYYMREMLEQLDLKRLTKLAESILERAILNKFVKLSS